MPEQRNDPTHHDDARAERFQVLALDGGGLKGLFPAAVLAAVEEDLGVVLADHFDLVVGTSTGGLVALAMGAGMRPAEMVDFYVREGPAVFCAGRGVVRGAFRARHRPDRLRLALTHVFGEMTLGESTKRLVIPSYSLDAQDVYVFKTKHHPRLKRDWRERMVDVAMATTAAPTYLPSFRLRHNRLVDGGVWANNPTLLGVVEAVSMLDVALGNIHVLSFGTTEPVTALSTVLNNGGWLQWGLSGSTAMLRAQTLGTFHSAEHLIGPDHIVRVNPPVPKWLFRLDRVKPDAIRGLAEDVARRVGPEIAKFTAHIAPPFRPSGEETP